MCRATADRLWAGEKAGRGVAGHAVILSVLFDRGGVLRGLRFITDPRAAPHERRMAHMLRLAVINRYQPSGWTCTDFPAAEGETPLGGVFLKHRCGKATPQPRLILQPPSLHNPPHT